ncbi:DUF882 domain-containing protein [Ensifer sp. ENS04]|uniref:D-Ala-D-Ala carboxypeptidase family metallohydrolase n=1 Tax=Ensifer sp. ENS04 TaxID=2769281 RepID=UPI00177D3295|nr:D-Ala-D-Ala carboxypeptidase family metallohydrolase [Ensifer sp. ENS04]MBD9542220.1 DUF882 domain-containing protein [Ensifer sp. ENS04]
MAREPVKRIGNISLIQPVASPVNSYVRPAEPAPSGLHQIAEGLAAVDVGLGGFLEKRRKKQEDDDKIRAEAAFNKNNAVGWEEAVRRNLVPANASPVFMESYKAAQGNLAGIQLREKFQGAYLNWEGRNNNDPAAFQTFLSDFISTNVQTDDPAVLKTLNDHVQQLWADGHGQWVEESSKSIYNSSLSTRAAIAGRSIDAANDEGLGTGKGTDYTALWQTILKQREEGLKAGHRREDIDKEVVNTIAAKALEHGDPALLDLLDNMVPGDTVKLSDYPDYRDIKADTISKLESAARQQMVETDARQTKIDKERENAIQDGVARVLADDPGAEIPEEVLNEWARYDGMARKKLVEMRKALAEGRNFEDSEDINKLHLQIREGAGKDVVYKAFQEGLIRDTSTLKDLLDRTDRYQKARQEGTGILSGQTAKRYLGMIKDRTADKGAGPLVPDFFGGAGAGLTDEGLQATQDFELMLIQWDEKNPEATIIEREKAINEMGDIILQRIDPAVTDSKDPKKYIGEQDLQKRNAEEQMRPDGKPTPVPGQQEFNAEEGSVTEQFYNSDKPPMLDRLPDEYQNYIKENLPEGMTEDEFNEMIWRKTQELKNGGVLNPETGLVEPAEQGDIGPTNVEIGNLIDDAMVSTPNSSANEESHILNLLGQAEGTDKGRGYDETLAYGALTGGPVELTKMTVNQVRDLQRQMLAHPDNKWNSSAVGRYQIVGDAMDTLINTMGLSGDELFDKDLQDRMALQLLERRGLSKWRDGSMSDQQFLDNLADEWQSFGDRRRASSQQIIQALNRGQGGPMKGLMALVSSSKRGYQPDLENLQPKVKSGVSTLQEAWGKPLPIVSGFRDPERNRKAGGAKHSQHQHGNAVDIDVSSLSQDERLNLIRLASSQGFTGIGVYANSIHLDYGKRRAWGPSHGSESVPGWAQSAIGDHLKGRTS